jgi:cytochrome c-type biogenesis protein
MVTYVLAIITAFWLGILTSISPCPLATNIAAVSYISRKLNKRNVIISGIFYTIGRMAAYILVSAIIVFSIVSTPALSMFLQQHTPKIIGPLLIVTGMFLLELITVSIPGTKNMVNAQKYGLFAEVVIGFVFALSFCPVSAALFLGSLIPLAVSQNSVFVLPLIYGIGTAIPVLVFAILFTISAEKMGQWFNKVTAAELRIRQAFGIVLILIGVFFTLRYIFGIV